MFNYIFYNIILRFLVGLVTIALHFLIPIAIIIIFQLIFRKKHKAFCNIISIFLVIVTILSYMLVGYAAKSPIESKQDISLSVNDCQSNYFYIDKFNSNENLYYRGKIFVYDKDKFNLENALLEGFGSGEIFDLTLELGKIGNSLMKNETLRSVQTADDYTISYSPVILSKACFVFGRNVYFGFIIIEKQNEIVFIPYELYFSDSNYNDIFFTEIYSDKIKIDISEIFENTVSAEEYNKLKYS